MSTTSTTPPPPFDERTFTELRAAATRLLQLPEVRSLVLIVDWTDDYNVPYGMMLGRDDHGQPGPVRSPGAIIGCLAQTLKMLKHQGAVLEAQVQDLVQLANALGKQLYNSEEMRGRQSPPSGPAPPS